MNGVGMVAVIALGVICMGQGWLLLRLVLAVVPRASVQGHSVPVRAAERRTAASTQRLYRDDFRPPHPSDWPLQGDGDEAR